MTAQLDFWFSMILTRDGEITVFGGFDAPMVSLEVPGLNASRYTITLPALSAAPTSAEARTLWEWSATNKFSVLAMRIIGDGYLYLWEKVDQPTSASDPTPSGVAGNIRWRALDLSCEVPEIWNTNTKRTHPTLATDCGGSASLPSVLTLSPPLTGVVEGQVYKVVGWNPSTTDEVLVEVFQIN